MTHRLAQLALLIVGVPIWIVAFPVLLLTALPVLWRPGPFDKPMEGM